MVWWTNTSEMPMSLPTSVLSTLYNALQRKRPSTSYLIRTTKSSERLLAVLSERFEDIVSDNEALAHLRIEASNLLVKNIMTCLQRLESHATYFRLEASTALKNTSTIWQQVTGNLSATLLRAEVHEQQVQAIEQVVKILHQFVGMHMDAVDDIRSSLERKRSDQLARTVVFVCRQAGAFVHAVSQSTSDSNLLNRIEDTIRSSIGASPRRDVSDQVNVARQLGRFWNQNIENSSSGHRLSAHDARLTLQIIQGELIDLRSMTRRLKNVSERGLSQPWKIQRHPLRYSGLALVTATTVRTTFVHSRLFGGTGQLEDKIILYAHKFTSIVANSVIEPFHRFYHQIFKDSGTSASEESVAVTRSSLRQMLIDFTKNNLSHVEGAEELASKGSMQAVMDLVKEQARHPLRNSVAGSLGQALLLQIQKLKCDVEELMLKSKQLLRAQELNLALVALVPSLLSVSALMYMISTLSTQWRSRNTEMIVSSGQTAKFLLADVHRNLLMIESDGSLDTMSMEFAMRQFQLTGAIHVRTSELEELIEKQLITAPRKVLLRFLTDLQLLRSSSHNFETRRRHIDRMFQCYRFLHCS